MKEVQAQKKCTTTSICAVAAQKLVIEMDIFGRARGTGVNAAGGGGG